MITPDSRVRVYVCTEATDMRKSFSGLSGLARDHIKQDPLSGHVFCFFNRRRNYIKLLFWDRTGYCIIAKRIIKGGFSNTDKAEITMKELKVILEGIELRTAKWKKNYEYIPQ
jgi:transposase